MSQDAMAGFIIGCLATGFLGWQVMISNGGQAMLRGECYVIEYSKNLSCAGNVYNLQSSQSY